MSRATDRDTFRVSLDTPAMFRRLKIFIYLSKLFRSLDNLVLDSVSMNEIYEFNLLPISHSLFLFLHSKEG